MKIIEYNIVSNTSGYELQRFINELINEGWQPFGSLAYTLDIQDAGVYAQALVKYELVGTPDLLLNK